MTADPSSSWAERGPAVPNPGTCSTWKASNFQKMSASGLWTVVGGAERGGIIVRAERGLDSSVAAQRLATGAKVKGLECFEGRMRYELLEGEGPSEGWVTVSLKDKDLLVRLQDVKGEKEADASEDSTSDGDSQNAPYVTSGDSDRESPKNGLLSDKISKDEKEALRLYNAKFGESRDGSRQSYNRKAFPWYQPQQVAKETSDEVIQAMAYEGEAKNTCVHPECMAAVVIEDMQEQETKFLAEENEKKLKNRKEYDIGWRMDTVPKSGTVAERLGYSPAPQGLASLVWDEAAKTVRVASTLEPAAAVNLEYLVLALKVRRQGRREPLFSLDPVDPQNMEKTPQKKVFEPDWLAGTSVGNVMFQADYFLKELALGEYTMPIVGMMSVFDWSEVLEMHHQWTGREWFVVKKAEVRLAEDKTLVPFVKMGVEAREQVLTAEGLRDAPITGANHPLRRFADAFTRNFDLIAERKSVVYHLRELAKASVVAKFLVDSGAKLDQRWLDLADEIVENKVPEAFPEIPQLWNMRGLSRIRLENGKVVDTETGLVTNLHAIYGGVEFGLDRFELAQRRPGIPVPGMAMQQSPLQGMQLGPSGRPMFMPQRFQLSQRGEMPQGVDLNLDQFNLTEVEQFAGTLPACSGDAKSLEARVTLGRAFLESLRSGFGKDVANDNKELLKGIFNPALADRMEEGDAFVPPDPNNSYISKVRGLVSEEQALLKKRKGAFSDRSFAPGSCGPEFPRSWTSRFTMENGVSPAVMMKLRSAMVQLQVDATFQQTLLNDVLPVAAPEFNKATEDGVVFRIYRIGSLEVRTIQEPGSSESVAVVFSTRAPSWGHAQRKAVKEAHGPEKVVRGRLYLEALDAESARRLDMRWSSKRSDYCHYYVVLETEGNNTIVTEKLADGSTLMFMNPDGLEDRNSMAKLLSTSEDCREMNVDVARIRQLQITSNRKLPEGACPSMRKHYARSVFALVKQKADVPKQFSLTAQ
ncbi:hypothetical protein AK812_SmicGene21056 [Symbiodinium microadriaticum]|uniref:Uncharacterized protein n=1 Tax=Symbiodinium microadriaticum TaxID=2951 RepID=A0A1Q9DND5_SYMMI|nr:hypothetical protein AK812_SmicGene21056 [Symbiodinium microadriaticum]